MAQDKHTRKPQTAQLSSYIGNKYKVRSLLISIIALFFFLITLLTICYATTCPLLNVGGFLLMDLTRIAFIILFVPFAMVTLFVGNKIDERRSKTVRYPLWVELTGLIFGIFFGWAVSVEWSFLLTLSQGTIWSDPLLYTPFVFITPLITYLCFKGAQLIYAITKKTAHMQEFRHALLYFIFSLPILFYSVYSLVSLLKEEATQASVTLTHFTQIRQNLGYVFTGDLIVPDDYLYHITASIGTGTHTTSVLALRLNGVANIDGLYNFLLTKGVNKLSYTPDPADCPYSSYSTTPTTITFYISKVLADRFTIAKPFTITEPITCGNNP